MRRRPDIAYELTPTELCPGSKLTVTLVLTSGDDTPYDGIDSPRDFREAVPVSAVGRRVPALLAAFLVGCAAASSSSRAPDTTEITTRLVGPIAAGGSPASIIVRVDGLYTWRPIVDYGSARKEIALDPGVHTLTVTAVERAPSPRLAGFSVSKLRVSTQTVRLRTADGSISIDLVQSGRLSEVRYGADASVDLEHGRPLEPVVIDTEGTRALDALLDAALARGETKRAGCIHALLDEVVGFEIGRDLDDASRDWGARKAAAALEQARACSNAPDPIEPADPGKVEDICKVEPEACA